MKDKMTGLSIPVLSLNEADAVLATRLRDACRDFGFFLIKDYSADGALLRLEEKLQTLSEAFFALPLAEKMQMSMEKGGLAWRGFFPVGNELTSGKSDLKEGIYFGKELDAEDPRAVNRKPLHGRNLFPKIEGFRETVLEYQTEMKKLGDRLIALIAEGLELPADYFARSFTLEPTELFRIFHYPPSKPETLAEFPWGVGEHTDYGLLTILKQDSAGGLEVKVNDDWISVAPIPETLVCNVGDMLDYLTKGFFRSAPHRVKNTSGRERYSFPYFFDPGFDADIVPLPDRSWSQKHYTKRWDGIDLYQFQGTYGAYLMRKISKVFPELADQNKLPHA